MCAHLILLAENDRDDRDLALLALEGTGMESDVVEVHDGEAALDFFLDQPANHYTTSCDLMFLDLVLPKLDGLRVLRQLRWLYRDDISELPPIVILSDSADHDLVAESYRHGADGFLCKATSVARFSESVQQTVQYWLKASLHPSLQRRTSSNFASVGPGRPELQTVML